MSSEDGNVLSGYKLLSSPWVLSFSVYFFKYFDVLWKIGRSNHLVWVDESKQQTDSSDITVHRINMSRKSQTKVRVLRFPLTGDSPPGKHVADRSEAVPTRKTPPSVLVS